MRCNFKFELIIIRLTVICAYLLSYFIDYLYEYKLKRWIRDERNQMKNY